MIVLFVALFLLCVWGIKFSHCHKDYMSREQTEAVKGIFAIIILFSHMRGYITLSSSFADRSYGILLNMIGQLMVAIFFFYSGYGVIQSYKNKDKYTKTFLKNRILKTWLHFAVAVACYFILSFIIGKTYSWQDYAFCWIGWTSVGNSNWFIFIALSLYILTWAAFPIAEKFFKARKSIAVSFIVCGFSIVLWFVFYVFGKETWWYDTLLCYPLGMLFSTGKEKLDFYLEKNKRSNYLIVAASFLLFIVSYFGYHKIPFEKIAIYSICACAFCLAIVMFTTKIKIDNVVLRWLGKNSFLIYILQRIPMIIFSEVGWNSSRYLFAGLSIIATLLLVVVFNKIYMIIDKVFERKKGKQE
ncbi:MAG: acyltransferase [Clostridia bacterium]|nr:acyltransferase [Clostridia bacterium]